ncbi:prephenate dehydratase [candidate division KSB1 bacterium]|nr:prephenate dehydratase [candidate division KSB1 bacterium]NIR70546.1 prephenate dehydratase [candidate division KSB1 bacterium]NIS26218.1 prephenate dehydratase [candidate division KSB1 bacterium]NIT72997.1 prephenate dehydratase [candidate division KSB1 bacterium]NIU26866.1 prephenate dehydratase [candidate division KSB1 bacterium]
MNRTAFQGEKGAYSEKAALEFFDKGIELNPCQSFKEVFELVEQGTCSAGVVPIENSLTGSVHQNYDLLLKYNLTIAGEIYVRIVHCLMALKNIKLEGIKRIYSHPQALEQCQEFLEEAKDIETVPTYDTAGSAKILIEQNIKDGAAIASEQAAKDYGLQILKSGIESNHENYTRFLVLKKENPMPQKGGKTSIVFSFKDIPGALFKSLSVFALRDINLLKIESRPLHGSPWKYFFYLDFEGSLEETASRNAINHLKEITTFLKVLGSYPKAEF